MVSVPTDREVFEGDIATYWFENGILVSLSKSVKRSVDLIKGNVSLVKRISKGKPVPLLIYVKNAPVPDKETRRFSAEMVPQIYSAMAIVSKPGLASLVMKMVFALKPSPIPMKQFNDAQSAKEWLKQFV
jgi:hypothetical protein